MEWCKRIYSLSEVPKFLEALQSMAAGRYELALLMLNAAYTEADLGDSIKSVIRDMVRFFLKKIWTFQIKYSFFFSLKCKKDINPLESFFNISI